MLENGPKVDNPRPPHLANKHRSPAAMERDALRPELADCAQPPNSAPLPAKQQRTAGRRRKPAVLPVSTETQSALAPLSLTILPSRGTSALISAASSCGGMPLTSRPSSENRFWISGVVRMRAISVYSRSTIGASDVRLRSAHLHRLSARAARNAGRAAGRAGALAQRRGGHAVRAHRVAELHGVPWHESATAARGLVARRSPAPSAPHCATR